MTSSAPADLAGEQRCVYFSCELSTGNCSCEAEVNGQMCNACEVCRGQIFPEWYGDVAVNCTNIPGFEDFPTDCSDTTEIFSLAGCVNYSAAWCSVLTDQREAGFEAVFGAFGAGYICNCSDSGSAYATNCQSEEEVCCGDICATIQGSDSLSYEDNSNEVQMCVTFWAPAQLAGEKRCLYVSCVNDTCSSEAEMSGQMCSACEMCPTESELYSDFAFNCTNIPGFEDFPTDCGSPGRLFDAECMNASTFAPSTPSAAHPKILPASLATIFIAISFILW